MSQKSITSFFSRTISKNDNINGNTENLGGSLKRKLSSSEENGQQKLSSDIQTEIKVNQEVKKVRPNKSPAAAKSSTASKGKTPNSGKKKKDVQTPKAAKTPKTAKTPISAKAPKSAKTPKKAKTPISAKTTKTANKLKTKEKSEKVLKDPATPKTEIKSESNQKIACIPDSASDVENKHEKVLADPPKVVRKKWNKIVDSDTEDEATEETPKSNGKLNVSPKTESPKSIENSNASPKTESPKSIEKSNASPKTESPNSNVMPNNSPKTKSPKIKKQDKSDDESEQDTDLNKLSPKISPTKSVKTTMHSFFAPKKTDNLTSSGNLKSSVVKSMPESNNKEMTLKTVGQGEKGVDYDPTKKAQKYDPVEDAFWKEGEKVPYLALAKTLEAIEATSGRLKMIEILANFLRSVIVLSPQDLLPSIYLCLNQLAPAYEGMELGLADTYLMKAIAQSTGRSFAQIKADMSTLGDLGIVAEQSRSNQRVMFVPAPHTVRGVFEKLREMASMGGSASMSKKVDKIQSLFVACRYSEARFIIRSLAGKLRVGLAEQSVLQAIAQACTLTPPEQPRPCEVLNAGKKWNLDTLKAKVEEQALVLKTTYCECPNYDRIVPVLLSEGLAALPQRCRLTPGTPLKPMLAHPTKGASEVLTRFDGIKFTCEWKYDGERAQIHICEDGTVNIYSRNQENNTSKYPDILGRLAGTKTENVKSAILDCEAVAWDRNNNTILPFQILSTRKRKDANEADVKVQVCVFMFDLLYLNGESLVKKTFRQRRELLREYFNKVPGEWMYATSLDTTTMEEMQIFLEDSVKGNCEGLMVKTLDEEATYEIAKRSRNWLKLKKDYLEGVGDTLDVVVIGGYLGRGKRAGVYGGFLLACYDADNEEYQSICKIGTGFTDEDLQQHSEVLKPNVIPTPRSYYRYDSSHEPDQWFDATQVWEIKCADLSLSPAHHAAKGIVDPEKGISLRFPRFIRIRDDKKVEDATTAQQVADMYRSQDQIKNTQSNNRQNEEDFY